MKYIKFDENGRNAFEAPAVKKTSGGVIHGYNSERNQPMLLADGWLKYAGAQPLSRLYFEDGQIKVMPEPEPELPTIFTKLQIRRCLREHGLQDQLDGLLTGAPDFRKDWDDALDIDLNDPMMQAVVTSGIISQDIIDLIQRECGGQG